MLYRQEYTQHHMDFEWDSEKQERNLRVHGVDFLVASEKMKDERTVRMSEEEIKKRLAAGEDRTDYERLERQTDEEIEAAIREDPDAAPPLDEEWFRAAQFVVPGGEKEKISIRLDESVLAFFRAGGRGYQSRINDVLRSYVLTRRISSGREPGREAREGSTPERKQS